MKYLHTVLALTCLLALAACSSPAPTNNASSPPASRTVMMNTACTVKIVQNNAEVKPQAMGALAMYQLKSAPFQIEVSSEACEPSMGNVANLSDAMQIGGNPYAITSIGMAMAGSPKDDVLISGRNMDLRPDPQAGMGLSDSDRPEIEQLCQDLGRCPTQIFAFRRYWPFLVDDNAKPGKVATIQRFSERRPIANAFGPVPLVVFTKAARDRAEYRTGRPSIDILAVHAMLLVFSPR